MELFVVRSHLRVAVGLNVLDQILDRDRFEAMLLGKGQAVIATSHKTVLLAHKLADYGRGLKSSESAEINASLGVATALEHAAVHGAQGKQVAGLEEILGAGGGIREL